MAMNPLRAGVKAGAKVSAAVLKTPLDVWLQIRELPLVETAEALTKLPGALEQNIRATNELIERTGEQLAELQVAAAAMNDNIAKMVVAAESLAEATPAIAEMAALAKEQMQVTTVVLETTNENLAEVLRLSAPLEKVGERVEKLLAKRDARKKP